MGELRAPAEVDVAVTHQIPLDKLEKFASTMREISEVLVDLNQPLALARSGQRSIVEAKYSYCWGEFKHALGDQKDQIAESKGILRSQGCEQFFLQAIETIVRAPWPFTLRQQEDRLERFNLALRWAVHLSPGDADATYQTVDLLTDVRKSLCPLRLVNAYQAFKARDGER
jgi:hypothetical protein